MPARQRALLIAAGTGGGIAATFNTPIGGIVFAVELMLPFANPLSLL
jgi:chloride channel protein, CIC family